MSKKQDFYLPGKKKLEVELIAPENIVISEELLFIHRIVLKFYNIAINDPIIGFHFANVDSFSKHIPKITAFWETQLLQQNSLKIYSSNLLEAHAELKLNHGQINRFIYLFQSILDEMIKKEISNKEIIIKWQHKVLFFQKKFLKKFT